MTRTPPSLSSLSSNPRASVRAWSRYRDTVLAARRMHPETFVVTPTSFSPATFTSQLRDAIRGCIVFDYEGDSESLSSWWQQVVVRFDEKKVYIGPPPKKTDEAASFLREKKGELQFDFLNFNEIEAFMFLISRGRLQGPVKFNVESGNDIPRLLPNVELLHNEDGYVML